ncbi:MAG TPA: Hsp20/alpha crystallin family protein [Verrucomicrobiae bacterium]|nr:Hsp20/alpha crystallin family protein [Verrucomicrobiae bacterium]
MKLAKHQGNKKESLVPVTSAHAPLRLLQRWQREIERLFGNPFGDWMTHKESFMEDWIPAVNVYEEHDKFVVEAELPGMKKDEIHIYMSGDNLNITGQRKEHHEEHGRGRHRAERNFGHFHRTISLPVSVQTDAIEAQYRDGILTVTCPMTEEARRSRVDVKVE